MHSNGWKGNRNRIVSPVEIRTSSVSQCISWLIWEQDSSLIFTIQATFKVTALRDLHQSDHVVMLLWSTVRSAERDIISSGYYWQGAWYVCVRVSPHSFVCVSVCHCARVSARIYTQAHVYECECVCVSQCIYVSGWHKYIKGNTQLSSAMFLRG